MRRNVRPHVLLLFSGDPDRQRIILMETLVALTRDWENYVRQDYEAGEASLADCLKRQALHLQAKAHLLRARIK